MSEEFEALFREHWQLVYRTPMTLPKAPSIFTAPEQQLGLKLEPIRVPREFIVIDQVERPAAN